MNYRFKRILPLSLATLMLLTACDSQLDLKPVNTIDASAAVSTSSDVEAILVGAYDSMSDIDLYGGNLIRNAELIGDNGEIFWDGTFVEPDEIFRKAILVNNANVANIWLDAYRTINIANTVLVNLAVVDKDKLNQVEAEAKFIRAVMYFELVRNYAKAWTDGNPANNPGVPLVLTPTTEINDESDVSRATVAEVYTQIISDLTDAESKLPATNGIFATKWAAAGMLSRVYMMQERYADAAQAATRVIDSGRFSLVPTEEVFDLRINQSGITTDEDIFSIHITDQDGINELNTFFGGASYGGRGEILIEDAHLGMYEAGDKRAELFYEDGGIYTVKFRNQYGNVKLLRLAEMYLTRAEANFRNNSAIGATPAEDINSIRTRAGLEPIAPVNLTLADIMKERRLELAFEGHLIHDIKRTRGTVGDMPYTSPKLIFPIPRREIDANPNLTQNEGYL